MNLLSQMTLEEKIGQLLFEDFVGKEAPTKGIEEAILKNHIGGIIFFSGCNVDNGLQVARLTKQLQEIAQRTRLKIPLFISIDQEGGQLAAVIRKATIHPGNMAIGATGKTEYASLAGRITARELKAMGININFAPVLDVVYDTKIPVVDNRSFGSDPDLVGKMGAAYIKGLQAEGVIACGKHFPGEVVVEKDSHHVLNVIPYELDRLERVELKPFIMAAKAGIEMFMATHTIYNGFDSEVPASLSHKIITGYLREKMGFKGLVITDDIVMKAIKDNFGIEEGVVRAIEAGADLVIVGEGTQTAPIALEAILRAVKKGRLSIERINESVERILRVKAKYITTPIANLPKAKKILGTKESRKQVQVIADKSITLLKNDEKIIPLKLQKDDKVLIVRPSLTRLVMSDNTNYYDESFLFKQFCKRHKNTKEAIMGLAPCEAEVISLLDRIFISDVVIVCTMSACIYTKQAAIIEETINLFAKEANNVKKKKRLITVALRSPWDLTKFPTVKTHLVTYGVAEVSLEALVKVIFGEISATGKIPISIDLFGMGYNSKERGNFIVGEKKGGDRRELSACVKECVG